MALVLGTPAGETLNGTDSDDLIVGLAGNDTLNGLGGNDVLDGGVGDDTMIGGAGDDLYVADSAADGVGEAPDGGTDTVLAFVSYTLAENSYAEKLQLAGALVIDGTGTGAGDVIIGNMADNHLFGLGGDDRLVAGFGNDTVEGGEGNDTLSGGPGTDSLVGGAGDDLYIDTLLRTGNTSSGTLSLPGSITEDVEGGNDTLQVRLNPQRMTFTFPDDSAFTMSRVSSATNPIVGSWFAAGVGESNSTIAITFFADGSFMLAEDGNPALDASGKDGMERGTYEWNAETRAFTATTTVNTNGEWGFSDSNFINLRIDGDSMTILAADGSLSLARVTSDSSPLVGAWTASNSGESRSTLAITFLEDGTFLLAEDGDSSAATGDPSGKDGMERGTYTWNQGNGAFSASTTVNTNGEWGLSHLEAGVKVATSFLPVTPYPVVLAANVENLDLSRTGTMRLDGTGNDLANVMTGNGGINVLLGGMGDDTLNGNAGNDTIESGAGNDTAYGGTGNDLLGGDSGEGFGNDVLYGDTGNDTVAGDEGSDTLRGGAGNDRLFGAAGSEVGDDLLFGDDGNDTLAGGAGIDTLNGGAGADVLAWTAGDVLIGGSGTDTLSMGKGNLKLTAIGQTAIQTVEKADLRGDGVNVLTLARNDVLDMSATDTLTVMGDAGDKVSAAGFVKQANLNGFLRFTSGAATLLVETDVTVVT